MTISPMITAMFKKMTLAVALLLVCSTAAQAQKFGWVDSQTVLENMPEYKAVTAEIDGMSNSWQKELEKMYQGIEKMYEDYRAKEVLLSPDDRKKQQDLIMQQEQKAKEYQRKRFGMDGDLFKARQEKMRPVQDKLLGAIRQVATEKRLNMLLDKAGNTVILFAEDRYDYTGAVMQKLGIDPTKVTGVPTGIGVGEER